MDSRTTVAIYFLTLNATFLLLVIPVLGPDPGSLVSNYMHILFISSKMEKSSKISM